jgi:glycosyltransferase involved in cell wall biosynthesis
MTVRVALVYLGRRGGGAAYSLLVARALARRCDVLAAVSAQAENLAGWRASGVPLVEVPTYASAAGAVASLLDVPRHLRLRRALRAFAPDVVYHPMAHLWTPLVNALLPGVPKVLTLHDPVLHLGEGSRLVAALQRICVRQSARVIVLTPACAPAAVALGVPAGAVDVVPHGELSWYREASGAGAAEPARDGETLLFFGRISRYKGVDVLLDAFREVRARRPSARLLLVGSGELAPYAARLAAVDGVSVVNRWVADEEVHAFFARADVVVLPYVDGSQSGVAPIAAACGLPVVASAVGGLPDQIEHGRTGLLVPPGDARALARACLDLLASPGLRAALGRRAAEKARTEWSWDAAAERVLASLGAAAVGREARAPAGA